MQCFRIGMLLLACGLAGCGSVGPAAIPRDRSDYISSVADSWKEQTLLNVVRLRYGDVPSFLDVSSVVASYALQGQASAGGVINSNMIGSTPWHAVNFGAGVSYQDKPTISYTPLSGDKFTRSLLRPITPAGIFQLIQAGYPADSVLLVTVRSLNGIKNRHTSGGSVQPADPQFYPLLDALRRLQRSGTVSLRMEKRGPDETGFLVLTKNPSPDAARDLAFVCATLGLKLGRDQQITLAFGAIPHKPTELAVLSRSMAEILIELAGGIEVPAEHIASQRTVASARLAAAEDPRERPLVRILSGASAPRDAFAAVKYRDTWYWIDDRDFLSKRVFTQLMLFFSLAESGVAPQVPALTIPVN